ncbi:MAG: ATP-binding cassette domain-containing protein [Acidimicrobiia bacterium]|nr:ATP-binding cassette domain-containing protein [Acidimicrobiia bacterium]
MLEFGELTKRYGEVVALDRLSFQVHPGRILGFLGPNGAGKTTAMRCVFGLVAPDSGRVTWNGAGIDRETQLRFGYMPEERGLYPKMRVGEQIAYFARLSGMDGGEATSATDHWLARFDLSARGDSKLEELSHGNQQRVQLACALVHRPEVAVLDEPFAGLDPIGMETMAQVLRALAVAGMTIVFSSHQLDLVADVCQDVVIIDNGHVVLSGEVNELRRLSPVRFLEVEVNGRPWTKHVEGVTSSDDNGRHRYVLSRTAPIEQILEQARRDGELTRFAFEPPNLTDLFREAVGR